LAAQAVLHKSERDVAEAVRSHPWVQPADAPDIARVVIAS
jgi:hypothetical protein